MKLSALFASFCLTLAIIGCASDPKGPFYLIPTQTETEGGYKITAEEAVFENASVRVAVRPVKLAELEGRSALLTELSKRGYVILNLEIENRSSDKKVMYSPSYSVLTNDAMDYKKPVDFTDLYEIAVKEESFEKDLRNLKGKFYDLNVTMHPNAKVSKLLIFSRMSEDVKRARLKIQELYIGTDVIAVSFPFDYKSEPGPQTP